MGALEPLAIEGGAFPHQQSSPHSVALRRWNVFLMKITAGERSTYHLRHITYVIYRELHGF